jgi:cytidylate kinase
MKIAICGPICSGKTYLSNYLSKAYTLQKFSFGNKVKSIARDLFKMNYKDRPLIQHIADKMKEIDPDIWAKYVVNQIKDIDNIIIDDLRFPNEAKYLQTLGFIIIKLTIHPGEQRNRIMRTYIQTYQEHLDNLHHNSEQHYNKIIANYSIESNEHLLDTIDAILLNI